MRHLRHDHRYIFTVRRMSGRRILWSGPMFGNAKASVPAATLFGAARTFAEREARAAGPMKGSGVCHGAAEEV